MRLLNVSSLRVESGYDDALAGLTNEAKVQRKLWGMGDSQPSNATPSYAILSHRWIGQELSFQEFESVPKDKIRNSPAVNPVPRTAPGGTMMAPGATTGSTASDVGNARQAPALPPGAAAQVPAVQQGSGQQSGGPARELNSPTGGAVRQ